MLQIVRRGGLVYLRDSFTSHDVVSLTPSEAEWLSQEIRSQLVSELCVQLHLAAMAAGRQPTESASEFKEVIYPLKRG